MAFPRFLRPDPRPWWPTRAERRRLRCLLRRRRRAPDQSLRWPSAWRRNRRALFWWTLLRSVDEQPGLMLTALLAAPAWPLWRLLRSLSG